MKHRHTLHIFVLQEAVQIQAEQDCSKSMINLARAVSSFNYFCYNPNLHLYEVEPEMAKVKNSLNIEKLEENNLNFY